jgi:hypothetical protein
LRSDRILLVLVLSLGAITDVLSLFLALRRLNNLWLLNIYNLTEFVLLAVLFAFWQRTKLGRMVVYLSAILYALFWVIAKSTFEPLEAPLEFTRTISSIVFAFLSVLAMFSLLNERSGILYKDMRMWTVTGILIYFSGNITIFVLLGVISRFATGPAIDVWMIQWILNIIMNICFTIAFLCRHPQVHFGGSSLSVRPPL